MATIPRVPPGENVRDFEHLNPFEDMTIVFQPNHPAPIYGFHGHPGDFRGVFTMTNDNPIVDEFDPELQLYPAGRIVSQVFVGQNPRTGNVPSMEMHFITRQSVLKNKGYNKALQRIALNYDYGPNYRPTELALGNFEVFGSGKDPETVMAERYFMRTPENHSMGYTLTQNLNTAKIFFNI